MRTTYLYNIIITYKLLPEEENELNEALLSYGDTMKNTMQTKKGAPEDFLVFFFCLRFDLFLGFFCSRRLGEILQTLMMI